MLKDLSPRASWAAAHLRKIIVNDVQKLTSNTYYALHKIPLVIVVLLATFQGLNKVDQTASAFIVFGDIKIVII
jgi:hypothetical protein